MVLLDFYLARLQKLQKYSNYSDNITYLRRWSLNCGHYRRSCLHWSCSFWCFKCPIRVRAPLTKQRHNIGSRLLTNVLLNYDLWLYLDQRHRLIWGEAKPPFPPRLPNWAHLNWCNTLYMRFKHPIAIIILLQHHTTFNIRKNNLMV